MAIPITIPRLGWNMEQGAFAGWLKADGEQVRAGESLFSLESEKSTEDVECLDVGILRIAPSGPAAGDTVAVGTVIGYLVEQGEVAPFETAVEVPPSPPRPLTSSSAEGERERTGARAKALAISPRARRIAAELAIDWTKLKGSGRTGRIRESDIRAAAAELDVASAAIEGTAVALSPIRRMIAGRMLASHATTAPVTLTTTTDATHLVSLRKQFQDAAAAGQETVPSYTDFLVKLAADALQRHPLLNACWDNEQIIIPAGIHIGIAVDTDAGLLVPVLRNVPSLGLEQLAAQSRDLIARARERRLSNDEMQGGTFTITNLGAFGIDAFTPIINLPQCAVLGVGRIERRPVVRGEQIVAREQISLSLSFDHRIVDGAPAARFLQTLSQLIENPGPWLMP